MQNNEILSDLDDLTENEKRMATEKLSKLVISYSMPAIIGMLVNALYNIVDRFWVGKMEGVGTVALTGIGLFMPIANVLMGLAQLIAIGAAASISIRLGKKERNGAEHVLGNSLTYILIISFVITLIGSIFLKNILQAVGASEATLPYALAYARIIMAGCSLQLISFAMNHPIRAAGNMKRFASTQLLGAITNIILDPILIFNFDMGIQGAAFATLIAQFVSATWVIAYYFSKDASLRLRLKNLKPDLKIAGEIISIGFAPFVMQIVASFVTILVNKTLIHYGNIEFGNGDIAVGAMTIISSVAMLFFMPIFGINQGVQPIIGFNYGRRDIERVKGAHLYAVAYASVICVIGFLVTQFFSAEVISMFNDDPDMLRVGARGLSIYLSCMFLLGFQLPSINFFSALRRAKISMMLSLLRQVILLIPAYLILPLFFGFDGIWFASPICDFISTGIVVVFVVREFKILDKKSLIAT